MIDISDDYERDLPPHKRGRKFIYFPSGLTRNQVAQRLGCGMPTVAKWCQGLRISPCKEKQFLDLAGFKTAEEFHKWTGQPVQPSKEVISQAAAVHDEHVATSDSTNYYPAGYGAKPKRTYNERKTN